MSTILKSLKKLEKENEGQYPQAPAPALITGAGTHQAIHRSVQFAWMRGRIIQWGIIGAGGLVILVIALYALHRPNPSPTQSMTAAKPVVQPVPKIEPSAQPVAPVPGETASTPMQEVSPPNKMASDGLPPSGLAPSVSVFPPPVAQRPEIEQAAISPPVAPPALPKDGFETLGQKPAPSTMGAIPVPARRSPPKPVQKQPVMTPRPRPVAIPGVVSEESLSAGIALPEPVVPHAAAPVEPDSIKVATAKEHKGDLASAVDAAGRLAPDSSQPQSAAVPSKSDEAAWSGAVRMTDGALKVQAIVYAPAPEERMAVVNNTIVREGSAIESYTIVGIGAEDVFVREGQGRLLKVPFGKP